VEASFPRFVFAVGKYYYEIEAERADPDVIRIGWSAKYAPGF
jgi:hypothetical protein